ncbi:HTH-type transcriptional activator RhaR [bioreactor metagenome]|uniref:HTH-type transcriptional activator RhaR n=1 Tax=bioreactor metagenome TaxID=1076179 RepID=A0A645DRG9_9ZZZZ
MFHAGFSYSNVYRFMAALKLDTMNEKHIDIRMKVMLNESQLFIMKALFESLLKESDACTSNDRSAASSLISAIMRVLSQAYFNDEQHKGSLNSLAAYDSSMSVCLEYIDAHFTDPLSLCDHAKRFAFSKTTLSMLFPRYTGVTLKHYIANKRIEYASALIKKASMSLNEIAKIIGYEEFSTFYRNFTSQTGISPSQCRAK